MSGIIWKEPRMKWYIVLVFVALAAVWGFLIGNLDRNLTKKSKAAATKPAASAPVGISHTLLRESKR
jgi:hypothetical protein